MKVSEPFNIKNIEQKILASNVQYKPTEYDYSVEEADDEQIQTILIFCENIKTYEKSDDLKNLIGYYFHFCDEKVNYLEDLQKSFGLKNNKKRFTDIIKYLDEFTTNEKQHTSLVDFGIKISALLDILYSIKIMLRDYYELTFTNLDESITA